MHLKSIRMHEANIMRAAGNSNRIKGSPLGSSPRLSYSREHESLLPPPFLAPKPPGRRSRERASERVGEPECVRSRTSASTFGLGRGRVAGTRRPAANYAKSKVNEERQHPERRIHF